MSRLKATGRRSIARRWIQVVFSLAIVAVCIGTLPLERINLATAALFGMLAGLDVGALLFGYFIERGGK